MQRIARKGLRRNTGYSGTSRDEPECESVAPTGHDSEMVLESLGPRSGM